MQRLALQSGLPFSGVPKGWGAWARGAPAPPSAFRFFLSKISASECPLPPPPSTDRGYAVLASCFQNVNVSRNFQITPVSDRWSDLRQQIISRLPDSYRGLEFDIFLPNLNIYGKLMTSLCSTSSFSKRNTSRSRHVSIRVFFSKICLLHSMRLHYIISMCRFRKTIWVAPFFPPLLFLAASTG